MKAARLFPLVALTVLAVVAGVYFLAGRPGASSQGQAAIGGPFVMTDQTGARRDQTVLKGKWSAVFFGYTFCPDVCPTTLQTLARAQALMGPKAKDLQIVFVTVDPQRDTAQALRTYLSNPVFPKGVVGLTGTKEEVERIARAYRVYFARQGEGDDYLMDHSVVTYLMGPDGRFDSVIGPNQTPDQVAQQIRRRMAGA